jgi:hypothetical protein
VQVAYYTYMPRLCGEKETYTSGVRMHPFIEFAG